MPSYSDWLNANAGNEADVASSAIAKAQGGGDPNAVGNALKAGQTGGPMPTSQPGYGDFLKALQGNDLGSAAGQLGGGANAFDALLMKGSPVAQSQLTDAQHAYDQQQQGINSAYTSGQANANASTADARAAQAAATHRAGFGWNTNTTEGAAGRAAELKTGKDAQQAARDAGAQYRLAKERQAFEKERSSNDLRNEYISDTLNPIGGIGDALTHFSPSYTDLSKFGGHVRDPFGLGGNAHSGFGPGGKFGSPLGAGSSADPVGGQYGNDDAGFAAWLAANGYSSTGEGNGY